MRQIMQTLSRSIKRRLKGGNRQEVNRDRCRTHHADLCRQSDVRDHWVVRCVSLDDDAHSLPRDAHAEGLTQRYNPHRCRKTLVCADSISSVIMAWLVTRH